MKKLISFFLASILLFAGSVLLPASAADFRGEDSAVVEYEYFEDGSYFITTLCQGERSRGTVSGQKTATYINNNNVAVWAVTVYGSYSYTGYSSTATSASGAVDYYVNGASLVSKQAYTSGDSAVARATVLYLGEQIPKTVTLTCDRNGVLS